MNSGVCEGGPFHGKRIHHPDTSINVAMRGDKVVTWFGKKTKEISVHRYEFSKGKWIWQA